MPRWESVRGLEPAYRTLPPLLLTTSAPATSVLSMLASPVPPPAVFTVRVTAEELVLPLAIVPPFWDSPWVPAPSVLAARATVPLAEPTSAARVRPSPLARTRLPDAVE